jgi:DNA-directed RNA polymerase subunit RPC12/RpoP
MGLTRSEKAERAWAVRLGRVYGITPQQYAAILSDQGGGCAICGREAREFKTRLCIDHNHATREIRGILCYYCNHRLVGRHRDPVLLGKVVAYISQGTGLFVPLKKRKRPKSGRHK